MTRIKLDKVIMGSMIETYINYQTLPTTVRVNGSFPNGGGGNFYATIPYTRGKTISNLYAYNATTGIKMPIGASSRINPFESISGEYYNLFAGYNGSTITITASITNFSGVTVVTDQTLTITAVLYEVPYAQ